MVARGEIGLLIVQIGYNDTPYVSAAGFYTAVWAILLNTIIGPVIVGLIIKYRARQIGESTWGTYGSSESLDQPVVTKERDGTPEDVLESGESRHSVTA